jgi:hypothetical protein
VNALKCVSSCKLTSDAHTALKRCKLLAVKEGSMEILVIFMMGQCMRFVWLPVLDVTYYSFH